MRWRRREIFRRVAGNRQHRDERLENWPQSCWHRGCACRTAMALSPDPVVVGTDARLRAVFDFARVIADGESNVLITGELDSVRKRVAREIHDNSPRRNGPFVVVSGDRDGGFESARGGTLFLDAVDGLSRVAQLKLLGALHRPFRDVRLIAGSTQPLGALVARGEFRADLYYRLDVLSVWLPPRHRDSGTCLDVHA